MVPISKALHHTANPSSPSVTFPRTRKTRLKLTRKSAESGGDTGMKKWSRANAGNAVSGRRNAERLTRAKRRGAGEVFAMTSSGAGEPGGLDGSLFSFGEGGVSLVIETGDAS